MQANMDPFSSNVNFIHAGSNPKVFSQPLTVQQGNSTLIYRPKAIVSRYVLGQPVAFTDQPNLPIHYQHLSPPKPNFTQIQGIQTTSQHIPFQHTVNLSRSIYRNIQNDSVLQSRKRTVSYDNKISQSPGGVNNFQSQMSTSYVRKQTLDKILHQNTQLRNQNSKLLEENRKLKQNSSFSDYRDTQIIQLQRTISQLNQQILTLKASKSMDLAKTMATSANTTNTNPFSQIKSEQIYEVFNSCLQKYRMSILQQQRLLLDRYRLQCKNEELNQKKQKLQESRKQQFKARSSSSYHHQHQTKQPRMSMESKQNWQHHAYPHQSHQKHWRRSKNCC